MSKSINLLEGMIRRASQEYYTTGNSQMSDDEFDAAVEELKELNPSSDVLHNVGWGYDVNQDNTPGAKVKHKYGRAGSLTKCRAYQEVKPSLRHSYLRTSLKLDGLSCVMYYKEGKRYQSLTRGDGDVGIDITEKIDMILSPVLFDDDDFTGAVRGEIVMSFDSFLKFQEVHPDAKNPRNSAAGLINSKGCSEDLKYLDVVVYSLVGLERSSDAIPTSVKDMDNWLSKNFSKVVPATFTAFTYLSEDAFIKCMYSMKNMWYGKYPSDGIVLTNNSLTYDHVSYGVRYNEQAFKFPAEVATTEVLDVEWNLSKTRYLIPKVKLKTVNISGTDVSYCTGYNAKYIADNKVGPGAVVKVQKRGEIIPNIDEVVSTGSSNIPDVCPVCGHALEWSGVHLCCPNELCMNASVQDLLCWVQNIAPVENVKEKMILNYLEELLPEGQLTVEYVMSGSLFSAYVKLRNGGVQDKLMADMIHKLYSGSVTIESAFKALNIPRLGDITCKKLSQDPDWCKRLVDACVIGEGEEFMSRSAGYLVSIVGNATYTTMLHHIPKLERLAMLGDRIQYPDKLNADCKHVAITGKLSVKRSVFEAELESYGFVCGDLNKNTFCLITDDPDSSSSKNTKATKLGIPKMTERSFRDKYMRKE